MESQKAVVWFFYEARSLEWGVKVVFQTGPKSPKASQHPLGSRAQGSGGGPDTHMPVPPPGGSVLRPA